MGSDLSISIRILYLVVGFFHHTLTAVEKDELDEWILADDDNTKIFETCIEIAFHRPLHPDSDAIYDSETDEPHLTYIIDLLVKHSQQTITTEEKELLEEWAQSSNGNNALFREMPQTNNAEIIYRWLLKRFIDERAKMRLN